jgi:polysaccharide export outer membrane protein
VDKPTGVTQYAAFMTAEQYMEEYGSTELADRYRIQPGAMLAISIVGAGDEMAREILVGPDGWVDYPYVGEVLVGESTLPEIKKKMTEKLSEYYEDPKLVVNLTEIPSLIHGGIGSGRVSIINVTGGGGYIILRGDENLIDVIAMIRGITPASAWQTVAVYKRPKELEEEGKDLLIVECNVRKFLIEGDAKQNIPIRPGDIIYIPTEENTPLEEFYASLAVGNTILGGIVGWRDNIKSLIDADKWKP